MFDKEYSFKGTHAEKVIALTQKFDDDNKFFNRNLDVYLMAPIVGFLYQRKSELNTGKTTKIFPSDMSKVINELWFNYRLIILLDRENESDEEERINKAFRNYNSDKAKQDEELFEQYVRGGVDVLYEKLIGTATNTSEYLNNLYDFMEEINDRYNKKVDKDYIKELFHLAKM